MNAALESEARRRAAIELRSLGEPDAAALADPEPVKVISRGTVYAGGRTPSTPPVAATAGIGCVPRSTQEAIEQSGLTFSGRYLESSESVASPLPLLDETEAMAFIRGVARLLVQGE
jgi:hypothetical protein